MSGAAEEIELAKAKEEYRRFHWGRREYDDARRLVTADPFLPLTEIGELARVEYLTRKGRRGVLTKYHHDFGPGALPVLAYERRSRLLVIAGGTYDVQTRGIVG